MQEALLRSCAESGERQPFRQASSSDSALQEALAASMLPAEPVPEVRTEEVRLLEGFLDRLGLKRLDMGSTNLSEGGDMLGNQCFYLATARSWLAGLANAGGVLIKDSALQLKREIEASVLEVRGDTARREMGDNEEAYTDFLACALCRGSATADLAVVIFVSGTGSMEVYVGRAYQLQPREQRVANLALVWHRRGHFEAVVASPDGGKADITLEELLVCSNRAGITATVVDNPG